MQIALMHVHIFCDVLKRNRTLREMEWEMQLSHTDSELVAKLENSLLTNLSLVLLSSNKISVSLQNPLTA
jgi:hypothetical protein